MTTATIAPAVEPRWPGAFPGPGVGTFVGRDAAVAETVGLLAPGTARLVTITGPGGVGKTRLARHSARVVAEAYAGRVLWVDLDPLDDPSLLLPEVAAAMGIGEAQGRDVLEGVAASLEGGPALVILDPIDRVASGVSAVSALLERLPELTILATGRAPLGLPEEQLVVLEPLGLPAGDDPDTLLRSDAVRLFLDRLAVVRPELEPTQRMLVTVGAVCRALDGLPLAIELAAGACRVLDPHQLRDALAESMAHLEVLDPTTPSGQRGLRATLDRSEEVLPEPIRRLHRRLAVIAAPFDAPTAAAILEGGELRGLVPVGVAVDDGLAALVDASLLRRHEYEAGVRFSMLRTIRSTAIGRLEASGEAVAMRWAHAYHWLAVAEQAEAELPTEREKAALDRLEANHDDLRAALDWAAAAGDTAFAVRLAGSLAEFWRTRGHHTEGRIRLQSALWLGGDAPIGARRRALWGAGVLASFQGDFALAETLLQQALALAREQGDDEAAAAALNWLGTNRYASGDLDASDAYISEALEIRRRLGDIAKIAASLNSLAGVRHFRGDLDGAREMFEESLALKVRQGNENAIAIALTNLGLVERDGCVPERASDLFDEAVAIWQRTGDPQRLAIGRHNVALAALDRGEVEPARRDLVDVLEQARELNDRVEVAYALTDLARLEVVERDWPRAASYADEALRLTSSVGARLVLYLALEAAASILAGTGRTELAARMIGASDADRARSGFVRMPADTRLLEAAIDHARRELGPEQWETARQAGEELGVETAIGEARRGLAEIDPSRRVDRQREPARAGG